MNSSKRCSDKAFYVQGIKIKSGESLVDTDHGRCRVVVGRAPVLGEIHIKELSDQCIIHVYDGNGTTFELIYNQTDAYGKRGRDSFDPSTVAVEHRDAYIAIAVLNMSVSSVDGSMYSTNVLHHASLLNGVETNKALLARAAKYVNSANQLRDEAAAVRCIIAAGDLNLDPLNTQLLLSIINSITSASALLALRCGSIIYQSTVTDKLTVLISVRIPGSSVLSTTDVHNMLEAARADTITLDSMLAVPTSVFAHVSY